MNIRIVDQAKRRIAAMQILVSDSRNRLPFRIIVALLALLSIRALVDELRFATGAQYWTMFALPEDHFADLLQAALSYQFITHTIAGTAAFASWSGQLKGFFSTIPAWGCRITTFI